VNNKIKRQHVKETVSSKGFIKVEHFYYDLCSIKMHNRLRQFQDIKFFTEKDGEKLPLVPFDQENEEFTELYVAEQIEEMIKNLQSDHDDPNIIDNFKYVKKIIEYQF